MENIKALKGERKIVMLTCYDYQNAKLLDEAGIDLILVGDSLGMVVLGYSDTKSVTMEEVLHHTKAVARGTRIPIVGDMPIHSYDSPEKALENARKFLEAGAQSVKLEGLKREAITALRQEGIEVMGHLGLQPQTAEKYAVQGRDEGEAERIFQEALELEKLGVYAIVLECVPSSLAKRISESVKVPTIGIGAGKDCDGQVLVLNDLLGLDESFNPKFVKRYARLSREIKKAVQEFKKEVLEGKFPGKEESFE